MIRGFGFGVGGSLLLRAIVLAGGCRSPIFPHAPMLSFAVPPAAVRAEIPRPVRLQIVSPSAEPPDRDGWLHEIKHDGHRLIAIGTDDSLRLVTRNGHDRTALFREPFRGLTGLPAMVLDGESAVPDERGVTHIDALTKGLRQRRTDQFEKHQQLAEVWA